MRALIVGAGRLGRALAHELLRAGHDVRLLEPEAERLARLPAVLAERAALGSPLDRLTLVDALAGCDAIATATRDDATNMVVALAARRELRVPVAVAVVGGPGRAESLTGLGVHVVCPTTRTAHEMHLTLVRSTVESELALGREAAVYRVEVPARLAGRALREIAAAGRLVPVAIERDGHVRLAQQELCLEAGDVLHVAAVSRDSVSEVAHP